VRAGVGKTCLLLRYANDSFSPTFITTIGIGESDRPTDRLRGTHTGTHWQALALPCRCTARDDHHSRVLLAGCLPADFKVKMVDVAGKKVKLQIVSGGHASS